MFRLLLAVLSLTACSTGAPPAGSDKVDSGGLDTGETRVADADRDGYDENEDCDDQDASVNPGAAERCDGLDQNCDGEADNDVVSTWYADADGDGYGDGDAPIDDCDPGDGYVANTLDCDDGDGQVNPGSVERCNELDDDCDGDIDEDANDLGTWYTDADGDGFGDDGTAVETCEPGADMVATGGDCDDGDDGVSPGATETCDGQDQDCDGAVDENPSDPATWYADYDDDGYGDAAVQTWDCEAPEGYVSNDLDCDDTEGGVNPDATEVCDDVDQDCDGDIDDGASDLEIFYQDIDGDGYGDADGWIWSCDQPDGYVAIGTDCDDGDDGVHPDATETCDDVDQDCDGAVDESASDMSVFYADGDSDGYGDSGSTTSACDKPSGYVATGTDCDDDDSGVHPGALETCDDVDEDCDGSTDESAIDMDTWYRDADADGYGTTSTTTTACDKPSGYVSDGTDCVDSDATINPGASEACDGQDENCDDVVDDGASCPCDLEYYGDNAYMLCEKTEKWSKAQEKCDEDGYHLVTIDDDDENTWVVDTAQSYSSSNYWWMGYNDVSREGTWVWEDGSSSTYTNWHTGEPNDSGGREDCGQLNRFADETWNDANCSNEYYYICESY